MRTETQSQGERSGPLEPAGDGDGDAERPRKRPPLGRHTEEGEWRDYVCVAGAAVRASSGIRRFGTRTHHGHATTVKQKMKDGTVAVTPLLQRSLQCPCCPMKRALKQCLTMRLQARRSQPRWEARHNSLKVECRESAAHLLECPRLRELRKKRGLETPKGRELFFGAQLASFLKELFKLESPSAPTPDEQELRPARAVKRHRSPTALYAAYLPPGAAKMIGVCTARGMRKRVREADLLTEAVCFTVPWGEARVRLLLRSTSPAVLRS
ncbi:hypothetical protein ERJ75_000825700 [Trypanosoma vivax]|nr:hypothetical protein ERJ75_000825700 [Trypanosoma vivax]